jgi:hypothetical protein
VIQELELADGQGTSQGFSGSSPALLAEGEEVQLVTYQLFFFFLGLFKK